MEEKEKKDGNGKINVNSFLAKMRQRFSKVENSFEKTEGNDIKDKKTEEKKSWELSSEQKEKYKLGENRIIEEYKSGKFDKKLDNKNDDDEDGSDRQHGDGGERVPWDR